jgi:hypothetical protein
VLGHLQPKAPGKPVQPVVLEAQADLLPSNRQSQATKMLLKCLCGLLDDRVLSKPLQTLVRLVQKILPRSILSKMAYSLQRPFPDVESSSRCAFRSGSR